MLGFHLNIVLLFTLCRLLECFVCGSKEKKNTAVWCNCPPPTKLACKHQSWALCLCDFPALPILKLQSQKSHWGSKKVGIALGPAANSESHLQKLKSCQALVNIHFLTMIPTKFRAHLQC